MGILTPKLKYPGFFENGLVGLEVTEEIKHREAFIAVPYHAIISVDTCLQDKSLAKFYEENPQLFTNKKWDYEHLILTTYIMHHR